MTLYLEPKSIFKKLIGIISILFIANIFSVIIKLYGPPLDQVRYSIKLLLSIGPYFDLNVEANIPTFFSSILLLICSLLLFLIGFNDNKENKKFSRWFILSLIFLFLSIDEFAQIHENFIYIVRGIKQVGGLFYFAWVIPYGILLILLIPFMYKFVMNIPIKLRRLMILSGFMYIFGALILEMPEGWVAEKYGYDNLLYSTLCTIEEILEMLGLSLFIFTLLSYKMIKIDIK